jgi:hypothetical protein
MQGPLRFGVGDHCLTESVEILGKDSVASRYRRISQPR